MIPAILIYLFKANVALTLFFLAYRLGLRRLTFYTLNRVFLLSGIVCSSLFPLVSVNAFVDRHETIAGGIAYLPDLSALTVPDERFTVWSALVYLFWIGVAVMTIRLAIQLISLWRIHRRSSPDTVDGVPVRTLQQQVNPFSFFRYIYINPSLHQPDERFGILSHEQVHVQQWHSIDVILGELNNIFYWFNPGAWLMKTAIRENLEFITDRHLLKQGVDKTAYQYSLIKVSGIPYATAIANNFNFSHLKNRIIMMNSKKSSTIQLVRYVALGALVGGLVLSLNYSKASVSPWKSSPAVADTTIKPGVILETRRARSHSPAVRPNPNPDPKGATVVEKRPEVTVQQVTAPDGSAATTVNMSADRATVVAPTVTIQPGQSPLKTADGQEPIYIINDKVCTSSAEISALSPGDIESVSVYKGERMPGSMIAELGERARAGVIVVYTRAWLVSNKKRYEPATSVQGKAPGESAGQGKAVQELRRGASGGKAAVLTEDELKARAKARKIDDNDPDKKIYIRLEGEAAGLVVRENGYTATGNAVYLIPKEQPKKTAQ
ncbi:M56 family metallopeptidase [Chitinophaga qingshengii]|uniref:M56 family metallopeptidase n=1 Tax=Chitinophaga qingshengii TaxID=1569794 RepID=A0ABR7TSM1_9BACT|nr:M56 family metallopeptidase [Chitinophaga qingshengii]MBC9932593.1 M56 family metallopeptidase [Chitinophaga qingshengii]